MLMLGRVLVALVGIAATLFGALLAWLSFSGIVGDCLLCWGDPLRGWLFAVLSAATLVGTVAIIRRSAWGAVLVALGTGGMFVWWSSGPQGLAADPGIPIIPVLAVATVLAIAVAIGMARDKSRRGELTWRG